MGIQRKEIKMTKANNPDKEERFSEGLERKGGLNSRPSTEKPNIVPPAQKPAPKPNITPPQPQKPNSNGSGS